MRNILQTALPLLAAQTLTLLYNIVDRIYIGHIPGEGTAALGAVGLCFPVIIIVTAFTNLFSGGGAPLFAIERGRRNRARAQLLMNLSFLLEILTGIVLTVLTLLFAEPVLRAFGATDAAMVYSLPYIRIYILGTVFTMITAGMNPFLTAQGFPGVGMFTVILGAVCNLVLDPVFIFGMRLGVSGAAVATVISQLLSALVVLRFLSGGRAEENLQLLPLRALAEYRKEIGDIVGLGFASFIMYVTNSLVQICCNAMLVRTGGSLYVSVMTIVASVRQILETPLLAIADGTAPIISYNLGAGKPERIRKAASYLFRMLMVYAAAVLSLIIWKPEFFISIFSHDRSILKDAVPALHIYFFAFVFMTLQYTGQTVFKAMNKKKHAVFFSLLRKAFIVVPLTLLLPTAFHMGPAGVFAAEPVSNVIGGSACFFTMRHVIGRELRVYNSK